MKNRILQAAVCLIFLSTSCTKDDDNTSTNGVTVKKELLVGKWYFVDQVINGERIPYDDHEDCGRDYVEFKEDGTIWQMDVWDCEEYYEHTGVYSISDGQLHLNGETVKVIELNSSKFSITGEEDYDEDGEMDEVTLNFER